MSCIISFECKMLQEKKCDFLLNIAVQQAMLYLVYKIPLGFVYKSKAILFIITSSSNNNKNDRTVMYIHHDCVLIRLCIDMQKYRSKL